MIIMSEEKKEKKGQTAREVAEAMVANMKANMEDPDFLDRQDRYREEATKKVLEKRRLRKLKEQQEEIK